MNLPDLIKTGESDTVEFKEKFDERTIESAVAFANTNSSFKDVLKTDALQGRSYSP
jgi:hypothetical protein